MQPETRQPVKPVSVPRLGIVLCLLTAALAVGAPARAAQGPHRARRVLLLHSDEVRLPVGDIQDTVFRETLTRFDDAIDIYSESLDESRLGAGTSVGDDQFIADYFREKYSLVGLDLVVAIKAPALDFALRHRDALQHAPIVFCNVADGHRSIAALPADVAGTVTDYRAFLSPALARRLQPNLAHVAIVVGSSEREAQFVNLARRIAAADARADVSVEFWIGLTRDELTARISGLPANSALIYVSQVRDRAGQFYVPQELLATLAAASNVPIYSTSSTYLGTGTVGGLVFDAKADSQAAAALAVRVLARAPRDAIRTVASPAVYMFDARALARYRIAESQLPTGSTVLFRERSTWDLYRRQTLLVLAFFIVETSLVIGLLFQVRQRRKSEAALRASSAEVRDLVGKLISAEEDERRRMAIDLHDDISQELALLGIELEQLEQSAASSGASFARRTAAAVRRVASLATSLRNLSHRLHPAKLELLGLTGALDALCRDVSAAHLMPIEFRGDAMPARVAPDAALCLYRVAQEALHNVVKHSGSRRALVSLTVRDGSLVMEVVDSGIGFDAEERLAEGLGLVSMRERLHYLGGRFEIASARGKGTRLTVQIPCGPAAFGDRATALHERASA